MFQHVRSPDKLHLRPPECDRFFFCESVDANCANESIGLKNVSWHCSWMDQLHASELTS
jgi:hypothetical protein